jgi:galactose mutarotase-like enzyme
VEHDAPCLGIWGWPGAPFAAIEPWHGIDDMEGTGGNLEEKPFIQRLASGETWEAGIVISVEDAGES